MVKTLREATLADNFLFGQTLQNEDVCRALLEAVLGKEVGRIEYIKREEDLADTYNSHGIRLDAYIKGENTVYDIEMQNVNKRNLERRCRYYQAGIDRKTLDKSTDYIQMPESYIIFVCNFDYYGLGDLMYERESRIKGTDIAYNDGTHVVFLNAKYDPAKQAEETKPLQEFLHLINNNETDENFQSKLGKLSATEIERIKSDEEMGDLFMTFRMMLDENKRDAREEGKAEGCLSQGVCAVKGIVERFKVSIDEALKIANVPKELWDQVRKAI